MTAPKKPTAMPRNNSTAGYAGESGTGPTGATGTTDGSVGLEPTGSRLGFREFLQAEANESVGNTARAAEAAPGGRVGDLELSPQMGVNYEQAPVTDESQLLDAWYGSFASPATRSLILRQKLSGEPLTEVVIGTDDRQQITGTGAYPWRAICSLLITAADGARYIGTGWFAGPRLVVTAGHCVFMRDHGGWVRSIDVIPGRNGATQPYGTRTGTIFRSTKGWTEQNNRDFDYGAILLTGGSALGSQTGFFGLGVRSDAELRSYNVNVSGYPGDKPVGTQWWMARQVDSVTAQTIVYQLDTAGGQSGAPVWVFLNNTRVAVGVHTNGAPSGNSATRITQAVSNNLIQWKNEAGT